MPTFAAAPIIPAEAVRERLDQASATNATPFGHIPPTPVHARNQQTSKSTGRDEKLATPDMIEYVKIARPIPLVRPKRSPSAPKHKPPSAAPNRKAHFSQATHSPTMMLPR